MDAVVLQDTKKEHEGDITLIAFYCEIYKENPVKTAMILLITLAKSSLFESYNVKSGFLNLVLRNRFGLICSINGAVKIIMD